MCKVYNTVGSLTAIKLRLREHHMEEFKSVKELINYQNNHGLLRQEVISYHRTLIEHEKISLAEEIGYLKDFIETRKREVEQVLQLDLDRLQRRLDNLPPARSFFQNMIGYFKKRRIKRRIRDGQRCCDARVSEALHHLLEQLAEKDGRHEYLVSNFDGAVNASSFLPLQELESKRRIIDELIPSAYGALGEQKVVKELESLPDSFILINDFNFRFYPPLQNRQYGDLIKSIQLDHILVAPAGVFLIETKNWSERSLQNLNLRSPVQQIKRANFALYKLLSGEVASLHLRLKDHHWGSRKVPIKNIIVLINHKPAEEFEYVKIVTLKELTGYINYFKPIFSAPETEMIADYLIGINGGNC